MAVSTSRVLRRNNVTELGDPNARPLVFIHGFGCSQEVWQRVAPRFADDYRVILFDHVGSGGSDLDAYDAGRYDSIDAYADDTVEVVAELDLHDAVLIGHSVGAMIAVVASLREPERITSLVLVGPSPRYVDDEAYTGGWSRADIDGLLDALDSNYLDWAHDAAPMIAGSDDNPESGAILTSSFCRTDPVVARQFAHVTFLSDNRDDLDRVDVPTLVIQSTDDVIAPRVVGEYVSARIRSSELVVLSATGHTPNLSGPDELTAAIRGFLG